MTKLVIIALVAGVGLVFSGFPAQAAGPRILLLSSSEEFAHGPIVQKDGKPSVADEVLAKLAKDMGGTFTSTKDGSLINAENLKNYDVVMFYTQGDLTKSNKEGAPPMGPNGLTELFDWIKAGGAFIGFHSATDTFDTETPEPTPYITMIGAEFRGHGQQFVGNLKVVDPAHPAMARFADGWQLNDEWYLFRKFNKETMHVLALMDPGEERAKQAMYNIAPYPVVWCSLFGEGRVYYTALGHREDVWESPAFQQTVVDAVNWTLAEGDAQAAPNYEQVVPAE